jgi:tetratricopeptide (TPR) repeat protein
MSREDFNKFGLHYVGGAAKKAAASHVVFVHGLGGNGYDTWAYKKSDDATYWPRWIAADFPGSAIWTFCYDAAKSKFGGDPMPIYDRAESFRAALVAHQLVGKPIVFVAHSLGGLVCKKLIDSSHALGSDDLQALGGVLFIATPHHGSGLSTLGKALDALPIFRFSVLIEELVAGNPQLRELHTRYLSIERKFGHLTYCAVERKRTLFGFKIVSETSADPGDPSWKTAPFDETHGSICKPKNKSGTLYLWFNSAIDELIANSLRSKTDGALPSSGAVAQIVGIQAAGASVHIGTVVQNFPSAQLPPSAPKADRKIISIPFASLGDKFIGRERELESLHEAVSKLNGTTAIMQTVSGLGGQGKTQLAVEYAHRYASQYGAIFWLNAEAPESLQSGLAALCAAGKLDLPKQSEPNLGDQVAAVQRWMSEHVDWLVVADNANSEDARAKVNELLGALPGKVLITTRPPPMKGNIRTINLESLDPLAAGALLDIWSAGRRLNPLRDVLDRAAIVKLLDRHVLSLRIAAAYTKERSLSYEDYLREWRDMELRPRILNWNEHNFETQSQKSTVVTFELTLAALPSDARAVLSRLAYLAAEPIPEALLKSNLPGVSFCGQRDLRDCLSILRRFDLLGMESNRPRLHRVVRAVAQSDSRNSQANGANAALLDATNWLMAELWHYPPGDWLRNGQLFDTFAPHAFELLSELKCRPQNTGVLTASGNIREFYGMVFAARDPRVGLLHLNIAYDAYLAAGSSANEVRARVLSTKGAILAELECSDEAIAVCNMAIEVLRALPQEMSFEIAIALDNRSKAFLRKKSERTIDDAITDLREAKALLAKLVELDPSPRNCEHYGITCANLADALKFAAQISDTNLVSVCPEALDLYGISIEMASKHFGEASPESTICRFKRVELNWICRNQTPAEIRAELTPLHAIMVGCLPSHGTWVDSMVLLEVETWSLEKLHGAAMQAVFRHVLQIVQVCNRHGYLSNRLPLLLRIHREEQMLASKNETENGWSHDLLVQLLFTSLPPPALKIFLAQSNQFAELNKELPK